MTQTKARTYVEVQEPVPVPGGFMDLANIREASGTDLLGAQYLTDACAQGGEFIDGCFFGGVPTMAEAYPEPVGKKDFGSPDVVEGDPFVVFAGAECSMLGLSEPEALARSRQRLKYVEGRQVDYHMARLLSTIGGDLGICPLSTMIMNSEYEAANRYGGYANILMSKPLLVCAFSQNLIERSGTGGLVTANGTRVAGIAHDDRVTPDNFFLTGQITLLQGTVETHTGVEVKSNKRRGLSERIYVPLIECLLYAGTATCDTPITP